MPSGNQLSWLKARYGGDEREMARLAADVERYGADSLMLGAGGMPEDVVIKTEDGNTILNPRVYSLFGVEAPGGGAPSRNFVQAEGGKRIELPRTSGGDAYDAIRSLSNEFYEGGGGRTGATAEAMAKRVEAQNKRVDTLVNGLVSNYMSAMQGGNQALAGNIHRTMMKVFEGLDPVQQARIAPFVEQSPLGLQQQELRQWVQQNPMPQIINDPRVNPLAYAADVNAQEDWKAAFQTKVNGKEVKPRNLIPIGEGLFVGRTKDGLPMLMGEQDLQVEALKEKYGAERAMQGLANGGKIYGETRNVAIGGTTTPIRPELDMLTGEWSYQTAPPEMSGAEEKQAFEVNAALAAINGGMSEKDVGKTQAGRFALAIDKKLKGGGDIDQLQAQMQQVLGPNSYLVVSKADEDLSIIDTLLDKVEKAWSGTGKLQLHPDKFFSEIYDNLKADPWYLVKSSVELKYDDVMEGRIINAGLRTLFSSTGEPIGGEGAKWLVSGDGQVVLKNGLPLCSVETFAGFYETGVEQERELQGKPDLSDGEAFAGFLKRLGVF